MLKKIKTALSTLACSIALAALVLFGSFIQPNLHNQYLRYEVGTSVVQVGVEGKGGGTGFAITADSGNHYIMTNKHVCEISTNGWVKIKDDNGFSVNKRIIYKDNIHDLCLVEGDKRLDSLEIGGEPSKGDFMYIVGHPGLRQLTVSQGEYIGYADVPMIDDSVTIKTSCSGKVYDLSPMDQFFMGREWICVRTFKSFATTAVAYGGNSGSPVVNKYGNVIGVLFAGSTEQERDNFVVPLSQIKRVLSKF